MAQVRKKLGCGWQFYIDKGIQWADIEVNVSINTSLLEKRTRGVVLNALNSGYLPYHSGLAFGVYKAYTRTYGLPAAYVTPRGMTLYTPRGGEHLGLIAALDAALRIFAPADKRGYINATRVYNHGVCKYGGVTFDNNWVWYSTSKATAVRVLTGQILPLHYPLYSTTVAQAVKHLENGQTLKLVEYGENE